MTGTLAEIDTATLPAAVPATAIERTALMPAALTITPRAVL